MKPRKKETYLYNENNFSKFNTSQLLEKINDTAAMIQRLSLHLEVQPKDKEAIEILRLCEEKRMQAMKEYEARYVLKQKDYLEKNKD